MKVTFDIKKNRMRCPDDMCVILIEVNGRRVELERDGAYVVIKDVRLAKHDHAHIEYKTETFDGMMNVTL